MRRAVLKALGLGTLGMGMPRRPDQSYDPPVGAAAIGAISGIFRGRLVVVSGSSTNGSAGVFVYSGTPTLGNLIASIASTSGTDPYGNAYVAGIASYLSGNIVQLFQAKINLTNAVDTSTIASLDISGASWLSLQASGISVNPVFINTAGQLIAGNPASPTVPETWHLMSGGLSAGFSGDATFIPQYRLMPDGTVLLDGDIAMTANHAANTTFFTLPAAYRPSTSRFFVCANTVSGVTNQVTSLIVNSSGALQMATASTNGNTLSMDGVRYPII